MASVFGSIFPVIHRHAEGADARFDIRRQDPDRERRDKHEEGEEKKLSFDTYDQAVVSVDALRAFLENFLKTLYQNDAGAAGVLGKRAFGAENDALENEEAAPTPVSAKASRAASLYQTASSRNATRAAAPAQVSDAPAENAQALPSDEIRLIHRLLGEIGILQARQVQFLTIERGETFLDSLSAAITKAQTASA